MTEITMTDQLLHRPAASLAESLRTGIIQTLTAWASVNDLPELDWTINHWDAGVTIEGSPLPAVADRSAAVHQWVAFLGLICTDDAEDDLAPTIWFLEYGDWHLEITEVPRPRIIIRD